MGKDAPKAPDPYKVSAAQTDSNKQTAAYQASLNRINQTSPFGSISYTQNGVDPNTGAPIYSQSTQLSPQLQGLFDSQIGAQQGISDAIGGAIGRLPTANFDPSGINTDDIRQRSFDSQMAMMAPQFEKGWKTLENTMADRGIPIGAEIWNDQTGEYNRARDSSILAAGRQADLDSSNEHQRLYGNAMNEYQMPFQTLGALMGNSQSVGNPQFSGVPQGNLANTDVAGNIWNKYAADQQNYQNQQGQLWSGVGALGNLMMLSDIRLKRDIKRVGEMPSGLPVYSYKYLWSDEPQVGVMAHEAYAILPEAVLRHPSGYLMVDYSKIT